MSWHGWSLQTSLAYVVIAALLYWRGGIGYPRRGRQSLRTWSFVAGLMTIVLALSSPLDGDAGKLFWAHMGQHVLLLTLAPPLILLGRPWPRMWRALPLHSRARLGRTLARAWWTAPLRFVSRPLPAVLLLNATVIGWHIPGAYDATLRNGALHDLEHAMFFFCGLLFWARVIEPGPLRRELLWPTRIAYVLGSMVVGWVLAIILVLDPHAIYAPYAALTHRPGGISALTDQQLAGGIMWVPGSIAYGVTLIAGVYRWLEPDAAPSATATVRGPGAGGGPRPTVPALVAEPAGDPQPPAPALTT